MMKDLDKSLVEKTRDLLFGEDACLIIEAPFSFKGEADDILKTLKLIQMEAVRKQKISPEPVLVDFSEKTIVRADLSALNLSGVDFSSSKIKETHFNYQKEDLADSLSSNLKGADFSFAEIKKSIFSKTDLSGSQFKDASFDDSLFYEAKMRDIDFSAGSFSVSKFSRSDMRDSNFTGADFQGALFSDTQFSPSVSFSKSVLNKTAFSGTDESLYLENPRFELALLKSASFRNVSFENGDFEKADLADSFFSRSHFDRDTSFKKARLTGAKFLDNCIFNMTHFENIRAQGIIFSGVLLDGVVFSNCDLSGADFKDADLSRVSFEYCNLAGAQFSNNLSYDQVSFSNCSGQPTKLQKSPVPSSSFGFIP